jgi:predicted transposase YbfD/YdcC
LLNTIEDHRRGQGKRYDLAHVLLFSIMALLSNADSYRKIYEFIDAHRERLNEYFGLDWKKSPAYTTVRNIIMNTSDSELERIFREYGGFLLKEKPAGAFVHCDGKTLRGSYDKANDIKPLHLLSAFAGGCGIILGHKKIDEKSNEIPAARKLIEELGLSGRIFTFDALHCQEKTLQAAAETGNDVIVQVKKNQKTLLHDCETVADTSVPDDVFTEPVEKTRNRIESRRAEVFLSPPFTDTVKWSSVRAVIKTDRFRQVFDTKNKSWKDTHETSFHVSTAVLNAKKASRGIRSHWGTENKNHYVRDVSMSEDRSRIRCNPHIFAKLRSFALNILRRNNVKNVSAELFRNCMNIDRLFDYAGIF